MKKSYRKLSGAQGKLKVLISIENEGKKEEATIDLYSTRSRRQESLTMARQLGLEPKDLENWLLQVLRELEETKGQDALGLIDLITLDQTFDPTGFCRTLDFMRLWPV